MSGINREQAREAVEVYDAKFDSFAVSSMHPDYPGEWMEELLDALEGCVRPVEGVAFTRDRVRTELLASLPADPKWATWVDGVLDRLEEASS